ncbi:hypothetical protein IMG5_026430 [Ichthyophthirius multifiliis]|uniref:EF-hand domain-containing protein n=1 Tax=Ichthyophthirius multifiliis TaxID=5932 RepID=G0QL70_ICHMU|nr:hypothetical protein IMG5_026430 [Ichthyophthirius multifiliis]EGR34037.1 hypothetical protein IMG5_026430 [Ichthyophthirius multifiliis]|eukprot:XP_004039341.1 hypothetical protein IMG5_026430 [Ichthyophthirius multifiliis]
MILNQNKEEDVEVLTICDAFEQNSVQIVSDMVFDLIDTDKDGEISKQEWKVAPYDLEGQKIEYEQQFDVIDSNKNGSIEKDEFLQIMKIVQKQQCEN